MVSRHLVVVSGAACPIVLQAMTMAIAIAVAERIIVHPPGTGRTVTLNLSEMDKTDPWESRHGFELRARRPLPRPAPWTEGKSDGFAEKGTPKRQTTTVKE